MNKPINQNIFNISSTNGEVGRGLSTDQNIFNTSSPNGEVGRGLGDVGRGLLDVGSGFSILCIGHITLDKIVTTSRTVHMPGGTSYYVSYGINSLLQSHQAKVLNSPPLITGRSRGVSYRLITSLAPSEMHIVDAMREQGIDVDVIPSNNTVYFENIYNENQNERRQRVLAKADPFTIPNLKKIIDPNILKTSPFGGRGAIILGSLLQDDFSLDVIKYLSTLGTLVVDAQGYLREVRGNDVFPVDWLEKREALKYIDILKLNEYEAYVLTGEQDLHRAAQILGEWGVNEVLLSLGSNGSIIYTSSPRGDQEGAFYDIPAYQPNQIIDATGAGDTYTMAYIYRRAQGYSILDSAHFAAAVSTLKLEHSGPFSSTEQRALELIERNK